MNQLIISDLPYINKYTTKTNAFGNPYTITNQLYEPYKNNMIACNQNFARTETINTSLTNQLNQSNTQITNLNSKIDRLEQGLNTANQTIVNNNTQMQNMQQNIQELKNNIDTIRTLINDNKNNIINVQTEIVTLRQKISNIVSFIPEFVKRTSQFFVRLVIGVKKNTLEDLEFDYDTHMLN